MKALIYALILGAIAACVIFTWNPGEDEYRILEENYISNIQIDSLTFIGCGEDEYGYKFTGTNADGKNIRGVMCRAGILSGWSIRYF